MRKKILTILTILMFVSTATALTIDFKLPTPVQDENVAYNYTVNTSVSSQNDIKNVTLYVDGTEKPITNNNGQYYFRDVTDTPEGLTDIYAESYDVNGNSNTTETRTILVDRTPPDVDITQSNKTVFEGDNFIGVQASDLPTGGADVTLYETNGTVLGSINDLDGTNSIQVYQDKDVNRCVIMYLKGVDDAGITATTGEYHMGFNDTGELTTEDMNNCEDIYTTTTDDFTDISNIFNMIISVAMLLLVVTLYREFEEVFN